MNRKSMVMLGVATLAAGGNAPAAPDARMAQARMFASQASPPGQLSLLTYNVSGLPWPLGLDRPAKLAQIADRLAALRATGRAPQVVVLQEAFSPEAEAIARRAGYRYTAFGPTSASPQPERGYTRPGMVLKGEGLGPMLSSGLILMSDFRISHVRRTAFPVGACAGYDCLANKGILAARIALPGVETPVEIVTTHFNSGNPSGQPEPVNRIAFNRQLEALHRFVADDVAVAKNAPVVRIFAGDFNMGHSPARLTALLGYIKKQKGFASSALGRDKYSGLCQSQPDICREGLALAANVPLRHANDWQFVTAPQDVQLTPLAAEMMFGKDRAGKTLSDHVGLKVVYQFR